MKDMIERLAFCIEKGKVDKNAPYPPELKDQEGASELTAQLLKSGVSANVILKDALMTGMHAIGEKFGRGKAFIPELLIAAKAMNAAMAHLQPHFESGEAKYRGTFIIGTVSGDLHDIGKNIVRMVLKGNGWNVIDLGVDVQAEEFISTLEEIPDAFIGLSALLTTTMMSMESTVQALKQKFPENKIFIGGAPVSPEFNKRIGADGYFREPQSLVSHLATIV